VDDLGDGRPFVSTTEPALTTLKRSTRSSGPEADLDDPLHAPFLWTIAGLVIAAVWVRPMVSSLWTDELGTWWVISGSARQVVARAEAVQGQSPLYYLVVWATRHVTGHSEFGLRLPSLIVSLAAAFVIYQLAKRFVDAETGRIAVIAFAVWPSIAFAASDARPYALAAFATVASTWALTLWLDSGRLSRALSYIVLAASVPYVHPLFGLVLIAQALYAVARVRERSTHVRSREVILAVIGVIVLTIPVALELLNLWRRHEEWSVPNTVTVGWLVQMLVPTTVVGAATIWLLVAAKQMKIGVDPRRLPRSTLVLLVGWFLIPAIVLICLAIVSPIRLLAARYFVSVAPAAVLLVAIAVRAFEPRRVRRIFILALVTLSILELASPVKSGDMRAASALVRSVGDEQTVVLVRSGFQESAQSSWYTDPNREGLLTAATSFYPVPGVVVPLPVELDASTLDLVRGQVGNSIGTTDKVVLVTPSDSPYIPWFDQYMGERGWASHQVGDVNLFTVIEFTRPAGT
jgi:hypothetical protein